MAKKSKKPTAKTNTFLTICDDCKIRLVRFEKKHTCALCKSTKVSVSIWRQ